MKFRKLQWLVVCTMSAIILSSCNLNATPVPTQDLGAIQTAAFNQVLTQVALASSPTPLPTNTPLPATVTPLVAPTFPPIGGGVTTVTPIPFNTSLPGIGLTPLVSAVPTLAGVVPTVTTKNGCNDGILTGESAPHDGDVLKPRHPYEKNFTFLNTGTCTWDEGYTFAFQPGYSSPDFKEGYDIRIRKVEDFTAPGKSITFTIKLNASNIPGEHIGTWKMKDDAGNYFGSMVWIKYVINDY